MWLQSAQKIFGGDVKNHLLYFMSKSADDFTARVDDYKKAASTFKGKVRCSVIQSEQIPR